MDVRLPAGKSLEGDLGWDVFSLQYHVEGPLAAVLSPDAMAGAQGRAGREGAGGQGHAGSGGALPALDILAAEQMQPYVVHSG